MGTRGKCGISGEPVNGRLYHAGGGMMGVSLLSPRFRAVARGEKPRFGAPKGKRGPPPKVPGGIGTQAETVKGARLFRTKVTVAARDGLTKTQTMSHSEPMGCLAGAAPPWMESWNKWDWYPSDLDLKRFPYVGGGDAAFRVGFGLRGKIPWEALEEG